MSKIVEANEKIAEKVVEGYKKIENGAVDGYKKIEAGVVEGFNKVSDKCVETLFAKEGESVEDAKKDLRASVSPMPTKTASNKQQTEIQTKQVS